MSDEFYLQDTRSYVGNSVLWWREGGGYTTDPSEAQVFTRSLAFSLHRIRSTERPWPKAYVDARVSIHVDVQRLDYGEAISTEAEPSMEAPCKSE